MDLETGSTFTGNSQSELPLQALSIKATAEFDAVPASEIRQVVVMGTITGAILSEDEDMGNRASRAPVDLVACLDRSASMEKSAPLVVQTLMFVITQLKSTDRLGLVFYDSEVEVALPLTFMSPDGKAQARVAAQKYLARSQTNLSGGLLMALDMLRRVPNPNDVSAVLLLTDGLANVGITKPDAIVKASAGLCGQIKSICSVFTFGFGREPDPQLLQGISNTSNGMYYFIDSPNAIAPAFGDAIGGLLSVVAQRLSLTIEADKGIIIKQIKTGYRVVSEVHEKRYRVEMDDLYSEERKDIICYIVTDKLSEEKPEQSLVEFTIRYKNLIDNTDQWKSATATMSRPLAAPASAQRQNREVSKQLNRIVAADAMSSALEYGMRNEYEKAQEVLRQASRQIHSSESRDDEYSVALSRQLEEETRRVGNEQSFSTEARRSLTSGARSHQQQRSSSTMSLYTTTQKSKSSSTATSFLSSG